MWPAMFVPSGQAVGQNDHGMEPWYSDGAVAVHAWGGGMNGTGRKTSWGNRLRIKKSYIKAYDTL